MSAENMANEADRIQLLQGTLDMLILRTVRFGPAHGHEIAKHIQRTSMTSFKWSTARSIRRCIDWKSGGGLQGNGSARDKA